MYNETQFAALLAGLNISNLLRKANYDQLTSEQKEQYDAKAKAVASEFRSKNPQGVTVEFPIDNISTTNSGRIAIVCLPTKAPTKNNVFQFAANYVLNMAKKAGVNSIAVLQAVHASCIDDNFLRTTFNVAIKGETFTNTGTGEVSTYEMTTLRNTNDTILLGDDAKQMLKSVAMDLLKESMRPTATRTRATYVVEDVPADVENVEENL